MLWLQGVDERKRQLLRQFRGRSFFKPLKAELVWRRTWQTRREVEVALFEYINGFYNPRQKIVSSRLEITRGLRTQGRLT